MKELWNVAQCTFAAMGGAIGSVLGGWDGFLYALILFVVIDYVSGIFVAVSNGVLSSGVGFRGIAKKVLLFFLVAVSTSIDRHVLQTGEVVRTAVIFFYLSNEGVSILENATRLGLPVPEKLKKVLEQIKEGNDDGEKEIH